MHPVTFHLRNKLTWMSRQLRTKKNAADVMDWASAMHSVYNLLVDVRGNTELLWDCSSATYSFTKPTQSEILSQMKYKDMGTIINGQATETYVDLKTAEKQKRRVVKGKRIQRDRDHLTKGTQSGTCYQTINRGTETVIKGQALETNFELKPPEKQKRRVVDGKGTLFDQAKLSSLPKAIPHKFAFNIERACDDNSSTRAMNIDNDDKQSRFANSLPLSSPTSTHNTKKSILARDLSGVGNKSLNCSKAPLISGGLKDIHLTLLDDSFRNDLRKSLQQVLMSNIGK